MQPTNICFFLSAVYAKKFAHSCLQVSGETLKSAGNIDHIYKLYHSYATSSSEIQLDLR